MKGTPQMIQTQRVYRFAGVAAVCFTMLLSGSAAQGGVFDNVPEAAGYSLVYDLPIPTTGATFNSTGVPYLVDNAAAIDDYSFSRIGYYLELAANAADPVQYVYASFDAIGFSAKANKLGVPAASTGEFYQQKVTNMNVVSNVAGIATGTGLTTGNVEFWSSNYGTATGLAGIGGDGATFDYNDTPTAAGNQRTMQIHNHGTGTNLPQTIFGFSDWGGNGPGANVELGIGTNTGAGHPDWTFSDTGANWAIKTLQIVVGGTSIPTPDPATTPIRIMPLGDSITYGSPVNGGYRAPLEHLLAEEGLNTEFVGSVNGNSSGMTSTQHEGHGGYTVLGIQNLTVASRISTYQPDVVLLMIGTNDMSQSNTFAADQFDTLIGTIEDVILENGERTKLIVAQIVPRRSNNTTTIAYNLEVARIVGEYQDLGYPVSLVDMYSALDPALDLADSVHPNLAGYEKMAATWLPAITQVVPEPTTMSLLALGALALLRRRRS